MNNSLFAIQLTGNTLKIARIVSENGNTYASDLIHHQSVPEGAAGLDGLLEESRARFSERAPRAVLVLSSRDLDYKDFSFPFDARRKVQNAIEYELTTDYPEDRYVHGHIKVPGREPGFHGFIAAVAARSQLVEGIRAVEKAGFRIVGVTADVSTLGALFRHEEEALVMDTDEQHTLFILCRRGAPALIRKIPIGLRELEIRAGAEGPARFSAEIKRTIHSFNAKAGLELSRVYVTGDLPLMEELYQELRRRTGSQLEFRDTHDLEVRVEQSPDAPNAAAFAPLLGAAHWKRKDGSFDFLKGELGAGKPGLTPSRLVSRAMVFAGVFALLLLLSHTLDLMALRARNDFLQAEIRNTFTSSFPQVTRVVDELRQARGLLHTEQAAAAGGGGEGGVSLLQALRDISLAIPEEVPFEIVSFFWETGKMEINARTDTFRTVNTIQELLEGSAVISQAVISNARHREEGQDVEFRLTVRLEG